MRFFGSVFATTLTLMALASTPAQAFVTAPCGPEFTPLTITEPWEENTQSFANGLIRVFEIFIDPNVASGAALGVLHPAGTGENYRICTAIYGSADFPYFAQAFAAETTADYVPAIGLVLTVPVAFADQDARVMLQFVVNQATGTVTLR